jgi:uncharacterized repeat protein (TIGR03806 family)
MPPIKPWMRYALGSVATATIAGGLTVALLRRQLFEWAGLAQPAIPLPLQATGILLALLGVALWMATRKPLEHRGFVLLGAAANVLLGVATAYNVVKQKVPDWFCLVVICHFIFFLLLATIARKLYRVSFVCLPSEDANRSSSSDHRTRWLVHAGRPALVGAVLVITIWSAVPGLRHVHQWWTAPPPLELTPVTTNLPKAANVVTPLTTEDAFPHLRFTDPVFITPLAGNPETLLVCERPGRIQMFDNSADAADKSLFLDITDRVIDVKASGEDGLSGIAFHPQFASADSPHRGEFFLFYTAMAAGRRSIRISKFLVPAGSDVADPDSEVVLIDQPDQNISHNGGSILFGPDGFLYVTMGDDDQRHPNPHAQFIDRDLFSGVLRIDVDCQGGDVSHSPPRQPNTGRTAGYHIPNDNPFVGMSNALEEFYAIGLRNPWRASFDRETGKYWVGDIGERRREEVNLVERGSNCGWAYVEGTVRSNSHDPKAFGRPEPYVGQETWPVYEYEYDSQNRCIIGGYVYRGQEFPELVGQYLYADMSGRIYALEVDRENKFVANRLVAIIEDCGLGIVSLGEDQEGELWICIMKEIDTETGEIHRLVPALTIADQELPEKLSETGLFSDLQTLAPVPGLVPYEVNTPGWSDRATNRRWIGLAGNQKIDGAWQGPWRFTVGTVFVQHFDLPLDERDGADPKTVRRLETRVLLCDEKGGVYGATYRWNDDMTDADLLDFSETEEISYIDASGKPQQQTWLYPGQCECYSCHNQPASFVLGFTARQLNRDVTIGRGTENQLVRFAKAGMFAMPWKDPQLRELPRLAAVDDHDANVEYRVRSYLDANCSHCHRPYVYASRWDARFEMPLESQWIVNQEALMHVTLDPQAKIVRPGDLDHSYLWKRMANDAPNMRMPPLGRSLVDKRAAQLVAEWIKSLPPPPDEPPARLAETPEELRAGKKP